MVELRFDFRDLFRSARLALSLQRIWINFLGLFCGYSIYLILTYVSFLVSGRTFWAMWDRFGLFPCLFGGESPWYGWAIFIVGCVLLLLFIMITNTAVSRAVYMNLKGETFYTWREAFKFAFKNVASIIGAPVAIIGVILLFVIGALIMGLFGKIPYAGEIVTAVMTLINMGAGLFVLFLAIIFCIALLFVPTIIATTDEDGFEAVFQSFSISTGQPTRLIFYTVIVWTIGFLAFVFLAIAVKQAWFIYSELFVLSMGEKFAQIAQQGLYYTQYSLAASRPWIDYYLGDLSSQVYFARNFIPVADLSLWSEICAYVLAISMLAVGGMVVAYAEATCNSGITLMYLVLRKKHDGENLLERKEDDDGDKIEPEFQTDDQMKTEDASPTEEGKEETNDKDNKD